MLRSLALIAVRQKHYKARWEVPLVFARADELIDDHLRAVGKIAELRFPQDERLGIVAAESVFETQAARSGKRRVVDFAESLIGRKMREWKVIVLGLRIDQYGVALVDRAALGVLPRESNGSSFQQQGTVGESFGEAVIHGAFSIAHFHALLKQFDVLGMHVEAFRDWD